jgi:hypothetical protein
MSIRTRIIRAPRGSAPHRRAAAGGSEVDPWRLERRVHDPRRGPRGAWLDEGACRRHGSPAMAGHARPAWTATRPTCWRSVRRGTIEGCSPMGHGRKALDGDTPGGTSRAEALGSAGGVHRRTSSGRRHRPDITRARLQMVQRRAVTFDDGHNNRAPGTFVGSGPHARTCPGATGPDGRVQGKAGWET